MKRFPGLKFLSAALLAAAIAFSPASALAVGTNVPTIQRVHNGSAYIVTFAWVGDAGDGSVPAVATPQVQADQIFGYHLIQIEVIPGSPSPTADYAITVKNASGLDLLSGNGANRSATVAEFVHPLNITPFIDGPLTLGVTGNLVHSAHGVVKLAFSPNLARLTGASSLSADVTSVNDLTGDLDIVIGTSGADVAVASAGNTITIDIPTASDTARGVMSAADHALLVGKLAGSIADTQIAFGVGSVVGSTPDFTLLNTKATADITNVTTTVDAPGPSGNTYTIQVVIAGDTDQPLSVDLSGTAITVTLGTDGAGVPDDTKNTGTLVVAAIDALAGVSAVANSPDPLSSPEGPIQFAGGSMALRFGQDGPSSGMIRFPDSKDGSGNTSGIWGRESVNYGSNVALIRLTQDAGGYATITMGDSAFGKIDFNLNNRGEIIPSRPFFLGTSERPFGQAHFGLVSAGGIDITGGASINSDSSSLDLITGPALSGSSANDLRLIASNGGDDGSTTVNGGNVYFYVGRGFNGGHSGEIASNPMIEDAVYTAINHHMTATSVAALWAENAVGVVTNPYFLWYNGTGSGAGVWRVNDKGIQAYYNPSFTTYTPGASNYERIVQQWNTNVAEIGLEASGTGTLRPLKLLGSAIRSDADISVQNSAKGLVLKDTAGTPHYWRVSIGVAGLLTTTDIGTTAP